MEKKGLTTGAAARLAGVSQATVRNYVRRGIVTPEVASDGTLLLSQEDARAVRAQYKSSRPGPKAKT